MSFFKRGICLILTAGVMFSISAFMATNAEAVSLYSNNGKPMRNLFSDRKACQVGDIVTIVISERTSTTTSKATENGKQGSQTLGLGTGIFSVLKPAGASQSDSFTASGSSSNTNRVTANVTVTIVEIEENGNLVVEGTQSIWQNKNEEKITLRGIIRPEDISANNTIPSTKISNATIKFDGKGPLNAKQRQGILTQIFNVLF